MKNYLINLFRTFFYADSDQVHTSHLQGKYSFAGNRFFLQICLLLTIVLAFLQTNLFAQSHLFKNARYSLTVAKEGSLLLQNSDGAKGQFNPNFSILYRAGNPGLKEYKDTTVNFTVPAWEGLQKKDITVVPQEAGTSVTTSAVSYFLKKDTICWVFADDSLYTLTATALLPKGNEEPKISFRFIPKKEGWYSVAYIGSPETDPSTIESIWQPLIWQERRFPSHSYLSMEHMCPLPAVMFGKKGVVTSVVADPAEVPFRMPTFKNARFGLWIRNEKGMAQPQIAAPVFGQESSQMKAGQIFIFSFRLLCQKGDWLDTYRYIARSIYNFHDYRKNASASLNETLENMIDLGMNDVFGGWNKELKAFDYTTDVKGTVKLVSSLHPLSLSFITDNPEIYKLRALPMIEFLMSREKYLFVSAGGTIHQSPSHFLKGPAAEVSELAALYSISGKRSQVFSHYADSLFDIPRALNLMLVSEPQSWQSALALYRINGEKQFLDMAITKATEYINKRINITQTDFSDAHLDGDKGGAFWTDFSPKWFDLLELYEETNDKKFLDAAVYGAKIYTSYVWLQPSVPDSQVLINKNGLLHIGTRRNKKDPQPMYAPPLKVPAWRVSQIGLTPEASNTYSGNPAIFLSHYAAYLLRLAHYTGDVFFKDIARSAIVGRYTNFPGYDINGEFTTIYQRPDYPLQDWNGLTYNQFYYNHIWPHIALLTDYLITDALYKSGGLISFPSQNAEGYAYLHSKVYGDRPGKFYDDQNVHLWMPKGLLKTDNIQVNYLAARGNGNLYLALMNQSDADIKVKLYLNQDIVPVDLEKPYKIDIWADNQSKQEAVLRNAEVVVTVKAKGITSLRIHDIPIKPRFQELASDESVKPLSTSSYTEQQTLFGKVTGMIITMGKSLGSTYIWLDATEEKLSRAILHYKSGNDWKEASDNIYPYEFSMPLDDNMASFEFYVEGETVDGNRVKGEAIVLKK